MALFYGSGPIPVTVDAITNALGYVPALYSLINDQNDTLILKSSETPQSISTNGTLFSFAIMNNTPTLIIQNNGKRYKFEGEEIT